MTMRRALLVLACWLAPGAALAQVLPIKPSDTAVNADEESRSLRKRFGAGMAERLMHVTDDDDDRLRGFARASADGSAEAISLLTSVPDASLRPDPRAMVELARALAPFVDQESVRVRLLGLTSAPVGAGGRRGDEVGGADDPIAKVELARNTAALAIASSGDAKAIEELMKFARASGTGQLAAANALTAYGISPYTAKLEVPGSPVAAWLYAESGDLRLLNPLLATATAQADLQTRAAAIRGLAQAGDQRVAEVARRILGLDDKKTPAEPDPILRIASAEALALLDVPARYSAVAILLGNATTVQAGIKLAERVQSADIVAALMAHLGTLADPDPAVREAVVGALGHGSSAEALKALVSLLPDARLGPVAAQAIARSPNAGAMGAIEKMTDKRLAARAYVLRRAVRGETSSTMEDAIATLARSKDVRDRAVGTFAVVAADPSKLDAALADADPRVRRMAAMGVRATASSNTDQKLLAALAREKDDATRIALSSALSSGDPSSLVPTLALVDRADSGGPDAPLAALAIAARARLEDEALRTKVMALLASRDPVMRAHVVRGLASSPAPDATGMLADAYRYEVDANVRRAIVSAIASRELDQSSPSRKWVLATAARLDPDGLVRLVARRANASLPPNPAAVVRECAWLRVVAPPGAAMPTDLTASYVGADGLAVPVVFDDDGYALVLAVAPGEGRLLLAPRVP